MKRDGRLTYTPAWDEGTSISEAFPNVVEKTTLVQNGANRIYHKYTLIKIDGSEPLEVLVGPFFDMLKEYFEAAGINSTERFGSVMNEVLGGKARVYYKKLINDPNGNYVGNANRTNAQHDRSLKDLWTKIFDETWLGDYQLMLLNKWELQDCRATSKQPVCDPFVEQECRKDTLRDHCTQRMHFQGIPLDEAAKIAQLKILAPEDLWNKAVKIEDINVMVAAIDVCEVLDKEYKTTYDKAISEKKAKGNGNGGNGKRKSDDTSNDDSHDPPTKRRQGRGNCRGNGRGRGNRNGNQNGDQRPQYNQSTRAPAHENATVVLKNGWTGKWKNCPVNPAAPRKSDGQETFDWDAAKRYNFDEGGGDTWYVEVFKKEARRRKAAPAQSNYQSPQPQQPPHYPPPYPPQPAPQAYHYGFPPAPNQAPVPPPPQAHSHHYHQAPHAGPPSYGAPSPYGHPSYGNAPPRHF